MKLLWRYTFLTIIIGSICLGMTVRLHSSADTALTLILATSVVVAVSLLRTISIKFGRHFPPAPTSADTPHDVEEVYAQAYIEYRGLIHQLWINLAYARHIYWVKAYYCETMHYLPGSLRILHRCSRIFLLVNEQKLELYGKVYQKPPRLKNGKERKFYPLHQWSPVTIRQAIVVGLPFIAGAPILGAWWFILERNWVESVIIMCDSLPITLWWQAYVGNNPSSTEK